MCLYLIFVSSNLITIQKISKFDVCCSCIQNPASAVSLVEMHHRGATSYLALFCAISCFLKHCFFNLVEIGMSSLETWKLTYDLTHQLLKISAPSGSLPI